MSRPWSHASRLQLAFALVATTAGAGAAPPASEQTEVETVTWEFSVSAYTYIVPEQDDYVQPTVTADLGRLHLEARYHYEALDAGSAWVGCNFAGGEDLAWELTPMIGGVFGDLKGIAPGYKGSLSWRKLELYSEGELVIVTDDSGESFFYNWSELSLAPVEALRLGVVTQRTRAWESDREIQRGLLAGVTWRMLDLSGYVFNPDDEEPTWVVAATLSF